MQSHKVERLLFLAQLDLVPRSPVTDNRIGIARDEFFCFHRKARGDELRIVVRVGTQIDITMPIALCQPAPTAQALLFRLPIALVGIGHIKLLCLAPHTNVRLPGRNPVGKAFVVIGLAVPHTILYVPVKQGQRFVFP